MSSLWSRKAPRILLMFALLIAEGGFATLLSMQGFSPIATAAVPVLRYEPWVTLEPDEIEEGATIPANSNVILRLPLDMPNTRRETLLGGRGWNARYWGYCFWDDRDERSPKQGTGFPGRMFFSEAERLVRVQQKIRQLPKYSIYNPPTKEQLMQDAIAFDAHGPYRHQVEVFFGGQNCYIMSDTPLPIGTDRDDDLLNAQLEKQYGTDPSNPDTDADQLSDGVEVFNIGTNPINSDTDGDNLLDGIELHGHTRLMQEDTDPLKTDSDGDSLCDGHCLVDRNRRFCEATQPFRCIDTGNRWTGEDKNLNGVMDAGETNPLKKDSDSDGITDEQEYFNCLLEEGTDC